MITKIKLVEFTETQLSTQPAGTWDDNGGEPDGDLYLLPLADVVEFPGMKVVDGFQVDAYSETNNYENWCGFSSRNVAYTTEPVTAQAIENDEAGILQ
jgi:hypothetical protein